MQALVRDIRREFGWYDLRTAVNYGLYGLTMASRAGHPQAKAMLDAYNERQRAYRSAP